MKMIHGIGRAIFLTTEYRTAKAAFPTSTPEEQERRFFYALMLRSRGKKSLEVFFSQIAEKADTAMWEYQQERGGEHLLYVTEYIRHRSYLFE